MTDSSKNFFWPEIGNLLVDSLNYSYDHGELSQSQKDAVITLIQKKKGTEDLETNFSCECRR